MDIARIIEAATAAVAIIAALWVVKGKAADTSSGLLKDALSICDQLRCECARLQGGIERRDKRVVELEDDLEKCEKRYTSALRAIGREVVGDDAKV